MRFRQLEVFFTIMQTGTVSAAAQRLRVSQPSVTKTLKQTEDMLGYQLFERFKGRLQPTEEARALLKETTRAYAALEDVRQLSARLKHGIEGTLRVASTPSLGLQILPDAVALYAGEHPRVRFELSTQHSGDLLAALGRPADGFDVGFTFGIEGGPPGLEAIEVGRASLACIATKDLPQSVNVVELKHLDGRRIVGLDETEPLGRMVGDNLRAREIRPDSFVRAQTYRLACDLARRGLGIAIVDCFTAANLAEAARKDGAGVRVLPFEPRLSLPVTAAYSVVQGVPLAARRMIDAFAKALSAESARVSALGLVVR
jgi:DNA-binding transcriptional LysR family regulator